ncbi:MAG: NADH-quinone oxidoreductase subunit L [Xanthomonadales bacterium]|uniref:NADH-quinone oxidoreductase subunit N n=1 Tax=Salinisphaera orenii TaxID=856731 RepID=UPI000C57300D|nr:NADH-quinone oxidoreductase subunit L [Xanthomonadales bacterium]
MPIGDIVPEIAVLITAAVILLGASFVDQRRQWLGAPLALVGLAVAAGLCSAQLAEIPRLTFSGVWALDGASIWARLFILATAAIAVTLTPEWLHRDRRHGEYYTMLLLSTLGAMALAGAADTLELVVGVLLSSVTGYTLAAYHRGWALSVEAGMKYFLLGALTNTLLMIGVTLLFGLFGTTDYAALAAATAAPVQGMTLLALALIVVGVAFKLAAVPAHAWMPDVAEGAPPPAAAFLTIAPKIGAAIALARILSVFPAETIAWRPLIAALAVATMTLGNLGALGQNDVRRLLGWSSVSQSGYALMAVTVIGLSERALPALLFFLAGYAVANLAAFAVVTQLRGRTDLAHYRGLAGERPLISAVLVLSFLSLVGIPPLAGFVGKLTLFVATIDAGYAWLAVVAVINTVVSLVYYLRVLAPMYFHESPAPVAILGRWATSGLVTASLLIVALGIGAENLLAALGYASLLP